MTWVASRVRVLRILGDFEDENPAMRADSNAPRLADVGKHPHGQLQVTTAAGQVVDGCDGRIARAHAPVVICEEGGRQPAANRDDLRFEFMSPVLSQSSPPQLKGHAVERTQVI